MYQAPDSLLILSFMLFLLGMGSMFLRTFRLLALIFMTLFVWGFLMILTPSSPSGLMTSLALVGAAILALAIHFIRKQTLRRLASGHLHTEIQKEEIYQLNTRLEQEVLARTADLQEREAQLRALSAHLQSLREAERLTLARDLHDELGQTLTSLKIDLSLLERKVSGEGQAIDLPKFKHEVASMQGLLTAAMTQVRNIIKELRPEVLDTIGLVAALEWQLEEFRARTGVACEFHSNFETLRLKKEHEIALFRIFQESLTNIARHAAASEVKASLMQSEHALAIEIADNGKGFPQEALHAKGKFGLLGMCERALVFGGEVRIASAVGQGTKVTIIVPQ